MATVTLSTIEFDPAGFVELDCLPDSELRDVARRVSRIATLDAGAAVSDRGHSDADRTLRLVWAPRSERIEQAVERLVRRYPRIHAATDDGFYLVAPESYRHRPGQSTLILLVIRRIA